MNADEQLRRIESALARANGLTFEDSRTVAAAMYASGVRVIGLHEAVVPRADVRLLEMVREAAARWEEKKAEARVASVRSDESERTDDVKPGVADAAREQLILRALAETPLGRVPAIQKAAGWHKDYRPSPAEWEPWRAAWRRLLVQRRIQRANDPVLGELSLWKASPIEEHRQ